MRASSAYFRRAAPRRLGSLNLGDRAEENPAITDAGVAAIAGACPHLRSLDLYFTGVGTRGVRAVLEKCDEIAKVEVGRCAKIGDDGVALVLKAFRDAEAFDFTGCGSISERTLSEVSGLKRVKMLNLRRCGVTTRGLEVLMESLPEGVEYLNLGRNEIDDFGAMAKWAFKLKHMKHLNVAYNKARNEGAIADGIAGSGCKVIAS